MFFGGLVLWIISLLPLFNQKPLTKLNRRKTQISGVLLGLHFFFFFSAVKMPTIANATFLGTIDPLFIFSTVIAIIQKNNLHTYYDLLLYQELY